ncbi:uncharacterized protein LOC128243810 isoform X2 [Mya arenaria]|uniref:uncharacterized protein LOC128243810 isoform X2 n=1 Tax=Mya arenaria TaxID=6604 RepID=UPI0022E9849A|nr:uncharacterized protein LOC128243810 isoform X2 [Mya arenaria]
MDGLNLILYFLVGEFLCISCSSDTKYYVLPSNYSTEDLMTGNIPCVLGKPIHSDTPDVSGDHNYAVTDRDLFLIVDDIQQETLWTGYRNDIYEHGLQGVLLVDNKHPIVSFLPMDLLTNISFLALCEQDTGDNEQVTKGTENGKTETKMLIIIYTVSAGSFLTISILVMTIIILKCKINRQVSQESRPAVSNAAYQDEGSTISNTRGNETQSESAPPNNERKDYEQIRDSHILNQSTPAPDNEYDHITTGILNNTPQSSSLCYDRLEENNTIEHTRDSNEAQTNVEKSDVLVPTATPTAGLLENETEEKTDG